MKLCGATLLLMIFTVAGLSSCASGSKAKSAAGPSPSDDAAHLASSARIPLVGNLKVSRYIFKNGLRLLIVPDHSSPTFAYQTWFRVGSRDEVPGRTGLAHLFEHMMFKQTKTLKDGEFDRILEGAGAEGENAFTSRDYTAYVQEMPKDKLELIAKVESDRMTNLVVDDKAFKTELEVVQNERRYRNENSPDGLMYQEIFGQSFTKHPYHWPVIGYQKDLEAMSAQDAVNFYHAYYSPNHATIVITGDVEPDEAYSVVAKYYGDLPPSSVAPHVVESEPAQKSPRRLNLKLNVQVEKLMLAFHIPGVTDEDIPALMMLQTVLTGGKSSRLYRALVESGMATGVDAYDIEDKDPSILVIACNLQKAKKATQVEAMILQEIARIRNEVVSDQEVERARNRQNFNFYEGLDTNMERANFLGHSEAVAGDFEVALAQYQKLQTVTGRDLQAVALRYLDPQGRTVITGVPK